MLLDVDGVQFVVHPSSKTEPFYHSVFVDAANGHSVDVLGQGVGHGRGGWGHLVGHQKGGGVTLTTSHSNNKKLMLDQFLENC